MMRSIQDFVPPPPTHTYKHTGGFTKQVFVTLSPFIWSKAKKKKRRVISSSRNHSNLVYFCHHNNGRGNQFWLCLSVVGMDYLGTTKVNVPGNNAGLKKDTQCEKHRTANLGLNTMVTGHVELIVIFFNPIQVLNTLQKLVTESGKYCWRAQRRFIIQPDHLEKM